MECPFKTIVETTTSSEVFKRTVTKFDECSEDKCMAYSSAEKCERCHRRS